MLNDILHTHFIPDIANIVKEYSGIIDINILKRKFDNLPPLTLEDMKCTLLNTYDHLHRWKFKMPIFKMS